MLHMGKHIGSKLQDGEQAPIHNVMCKEFSDTGNLECAIKYKSEGYSQTFDRVVVDGNTTYDPDRDFDFRVESPNQCYIVENGPRNSDDILVCRNP